MPQTIEQLAKADIKIWVLTGDKQGKLPQIELLMTAKLSQKRPTSWFGASLVDVSTTVHTHHYNVPQRRLRTLVILVICCEMK